jgi:hypothetical protein
MYKRYVPNHWISYKFLIIFVLLLSGCAETKTSTEEEIRQFIAQGVTAVEAGDINTLKTMISRNYEDERGYNRLVLGKMLQFYLAQRKNIHLFYNILEIKELAADYAHVTISVAVTNQDIDDESLLDGVNADLERFELELVKNGDWQVRESRWGDTLAAN